jgi:hypothetical protein
MTLGEKKLVALNIALSDKPYALIGDEKLSLAEAKLHGVIEYIEQTGLPSVSFSSGLKTSARLSPARCLR